MSFLDSRTNYTPHFRYFAHHYPTTFRDSVYNAKIYYKQFRILNVKNNSLPNIHYFPLSQLSIFYIPSKDQSFITLCCFSELAKGNVGNILEAF